MSKKFRAKRVIDLLHIPVTPVVIKVEPQHMSVPPLPQYRKQLAREEEAARIAAEQSRLNREEQARIDELSSPATRAVAFFWSQPLQEIRTNGASLSPVDLFGAYEIGPRDASAEFDAQITFLENLRSAGCTLYSLGGVRLKAYMESLAYHRCVSLASVSNWALAAERLHSLGAFPLGELEGYKPQTSQTVVEQPRVEPVEQPRKMTVDDLLACDDTREGQRRAREISNTLWIEEWLPLAVDWTTSLQTHFGFTPTPDDLKKVSNWIEQNNLNRLDPRTYDAARRWMASQAGGYWTSALTSVEIHQREIEGADTSQMTVEQRRQWKVRAQQARESDIRRFGYAQ